MINSNLQWTDHLDFRLAKSLTGFVSHETKRIINFVKGKCIYFERSSVIRYSLLRSAGTLKGHTAINSRGSTNACLSRFVVKRTTENYSTENILPPLYSKVLKDLVFFSNIFNGQYNSDFSKHLKTSGSDQRRRIVFPDIK